MPRGSLRIIMNWNEEPSDLDIYSIQIDTNTRATCMTNWQQTSSCTGVSLDLDNVRGGDQGPETITYQSMGSNRQYIYMIFIADYSNQPAQFRDSEARLTITDGVQTVKVNIEEADYNNEKYWLAGCVRSDGDAFEWKGIETFETGSPLEEQALRCMEVFELTSDTG